MNDRVERLRASLEEPLLVTNPKSVYYLIGFHSSNAALLLDEERVRLFTDFRYAERAREVEGVEFTETPRSLYKQLAGLLSGRIGFESAFVTYLNYQALTAGEVELVPRPGLVEALRLIKDEDELDRVRRASAITEQAYARLAEERFVGRTERELAWRMEELFHELGAEESAFPTIVAAGPNGSRPHAEPGDRTIEAGQTVVIDAGARVESYCADCTRTFATGDLPEELQRAYEICLDGQEKAVDAAVAGAPAPEVDATARDPISAAGFGDNFRHGLGHGVGLDVHEAPRLAADSQDTLAAGNVVTIEPGIYLEGLGGIRIEDLVIVTEDGPEVPGSFTKELVRVD
jgi:Xaa-Pro aminopeptidase